eukprot:Protomagalhaensia_sp_Gyna_25__444@NODE_120_length_5101_cov_30_677993_g94_i0_p1_GENE_NODE_120_length_5101_cov_30_677993_g94_i0NODE_120_length_5101_cov_30_677993_g94_i0_p1_ORF_typecomplete_len833_score102_97Kelch_4/PF13418_6/1_8e13Kelch_4/PF13418_6/0_014Kelch_4/PF13418_6/5_1e06Kelch_4/PF13418_6/0_0019Kelch_4/PF13418_6/0_002Kelch_4/PF13418_6/1_4Kelch_4/PF13418_6/5_5e02Kelch_5/PF13854_6/3_1e07Kelch_5/PF13854_6/0_051Kelch_5/PF13854_6/3_3e07Kelch_5/PF13854_6/0_01Kelch_5/PF13854_6/0_021Kelch_5/PF13854_
MASTNFVGNISNETQGGDVPFPRFGHSTTFIGNGQVILFGGAVGDSGSYQITNDCYQLDIASLKWTKLTANWAPQARAAHGAARVDTMQLVLYGGATGGGSLSSEELYLLDVRRSPQLTWMTVPITGPTPGRRYGHTLVYYKPNLIVFGGNDGQRSLNDIWYMHVERCPFAWVQVQLAPGAKRPPERVYHSAEICREGPANGMMVIFGGRTTENESLRDLWGLRQHRNGNWDWVMAPIKRGGPPDSRFQHTAIFLGTKLFVIGGRESDVQRALPTAVYDTEACEWRSLTGMGRFRHSSWVFNCSVYTFGGFDHQTQSHPTRDLQRLDLLGMLDASTRRKLAQADLAANRTQDTSLRSADRTRPGQNQSPSRRQLGPLEERSTSTPAGGTEDRGVRLSNHVHTKYDTPNGADFSSLVRKVSIDRLPEESKKIKGHATPLLPGHMLPAVAESGDLLAAKFITRLLRPNISPLVLERDFPSSGPFSLSCSDVKILTYRCIEVFKQEDMVLRLRPPIKVYGDIHGQYYDLMRLFGSYKSPVEELMREEYEFPPEYDLNGDIDSVDYLFLGDFVDRGTHSLEVMCLLLALKLKYPRQVHLIRGNHEDHNINSVYGFKDECKRRLHEDPEAPESCYAMFNQLFEYLPVGALIEDRILCIHGGIGGSIHRVSDIAELRRPLHVVQLPQTNLEQKVTDLLWSDPTDNDSILGVVPNDIRDPDRSGHIVRYGPDRVIEFLQNNNLDLIVRAHECVMDGFERFAGGRLITLFSATDYCNSHKNAGALLFIRRDLTVVPKIIFPSTGREMTTYRNTWLVMDSSRPPTPPRNTRRSRDQDMEPY